MRLSHSLYMYPGPAGFDGNTGSLGEALHTVSAETAETADIHTVYRRVSNLRWTHLNSIHHTGQGLYVPYLRWAVLYLIKMSTGGGAALPPRFWGGGVVVRFLLIF